jgi:hypothetical protein
VRSNGRLNLRHMLNAVSSTTPPPTITSAASTAFVVGTAGGFSVTTTGSPTPSIAISGSLPSGVTFDDNSTGTGILHGTPGGGTAGTYPLTFTAANGVLPNAVQNFTLTVSAPVGLAPAITSANAASFTQGAVSQFSVTTTGTPIPVISVAGSLPTGITFHDNLNRTATIAGTPTGTGTFPLTITAANGVGSNATQSFTLTVAAAPPPQTAPVITSPNSAAFVVGIAGDFTITATGSPTPAIGASGTKPSGVTFVNNGDGTATLAGTPTVSGSYPLTITASNGVSPNASQAFTLTVDIAAPPPPTITSAAQASFIAGTANSFMVTTTGHPSITESGALPAGVTLTDNTDGTATLAGTPTVTGSYAFTITATNGESPDATQAFTLTVVAVPPPQPGTLPGPPRNLRATWVNNSGIKLTWEKPSNPGDAPVYGYWIWRGTQSKAEMHHLQVADILIYYDKGLIKGVKYFYWITAITAVGEGPHSNEKNVAAKQTL